MNFNIFRIDQADDSLTCLNFFKIFCVFLFDESVEWGSQGGIIQRTSGYIQRRIGTDVIGFGYFEVLKRNRIGFLQAFVAFVY